MTSHRPCTHLQYKKARGNEQQKPGVHIGFLKLCSTAAHVDTEFNKRGRKTFL